MLEMRCLSVRLVPGQLRRVLGWIMLATS